MESRDVVVADYDPSWPELFRPQAADVRAALGEVALRIDHIGSTSVPGLAAKPIVDVQISVADFEPLDAYRAPLEALGYVFRADNPADEALLPRGAGPETDARPRAPRRELQRAVRAAVP